MKNKIYILSLLLALLTTISCEKGFEELNKNPFEPTSTEIGPLFNGVIETLQLGGNEQFYLHNEYLYDITEQAALTAKTFQNFNIGTEDVWNDYYKALSNIREIERRFEAHEGEQEELNNIKAMVKIVLAYKTFHVTDLFGDIPFSEAGRAFESLDYLQPKFDDQEEIYKFLLNELKWANDNINILPNPVTASGKAYFDIGEFDNLFNPNSNAPNSMISWQKFANSLRLRHALRIVEKDPNFALPILTEIVGNNLPVIETGEDVLFHPEFFQNGIKTSTSWTFREHKKLRMGSNIWHEMSDTDAIDGSGIFDPRVRIFFEPNNQGQWAPYPQVPMADTPPSGGSPYQHLRDDNYFFKGESNIYSPFNYYLIRDEHDIPEVIMTSAEVNFIKAEIYLRGLGVPEDDSQADFNYITGLISSFTFWQNIFLNTAIWENQPPTFAVTDFYTIANHPKLRYFENEDKLKLIYTQRWIDAFRQPWEAYSLLRRTGATPRENPIPDHYRFEYPPTEIENNPTNWAAQVAKMGADASNVKIWWIE